MNGNDRFLNINDAHLRVTGGNVHASSFNLDQISITTTSTTASTIDFLNETTAFTARSNIEVGTANLFVNTETSNVGIGTDAPEYTLDVHGTANVGALTATTFSGIGTSLTALNAGNITSGTLNALRVPDLDAAIITGGTLPVSRGGTGTTSSTGSGALVLQNAPSFTGDATFDTDTLFVDSVNNKVGVGTTEPGATLEITGNAYVSSNLEAANSKFSFDTNGTFKHFPDVNGHTIKMTKYIASASNMRIAQGSYSGSAYQWVSMRVKFTRLDQHTQTIQFDYLGTAGGSSVKNAIVIGDLPGASQANEVVVYNKTSTGEYEIYLQIDSATTIDVEIYHKGSTIDEHYATLTTANSGAIDETGLTMVYNSGTYADFSLRDKNVIISDDTIYSGLYNYGDTQSIFIDRGVAGGTAGTVIADTTYTPPPGVVGDVVCKFTNSSGGEAVTNTFVPPGLTCSTGDVFTFGVWALATQNISMEFFINPAGPGGAAVGWQVIGDGNWRFYQNSVTVISGASNTTAFFRVDNNTGSSAVYLTGATIRKNPVAPANTLLPYTPRYSPISGKGTVLATRNLIAKEAAIKTLTGNVGIGTTNPGAILGVTGSENTDSSIIAMSVDKWKTKTWYGTGPNNTTKNITIFDRSGRGGGNGGEIAGEVTVIVHRDGVNQQLAYAKYHVNYTHWYGTTWYGGNNEIHNYNTAGITNISVQSSGSNGTIYVSISAPAASVGQYYIKFEGPVYKP